MSTHQPADGQAARLRSPAEALEAAAKLASEFAPGASRRDRDRVLPREQIEALSRHGLFGMSVPAEFGGADVPASTVAEVFRILATADASIAQIPQSHFVFLEVVRNQGTAAQRERFFGEVLAGRRIANAQSERGSRTVAEDRTALTPAGGGGFALTGEKFYATGSLFAHWLAVRAVLPEDPAASGAVEKAIAFVPVDTPGVTIVDDWDGLGQRTTGSGTVLLENVQVPADQVVPFTPIFAEPTVYGAYAQLLHAAIDAGIARAALTEAAVQVARARPWFESGMDTAAQDLLLIQQAGELEVSVRGAEALLREAGAAIDAARRQLDEQSTAAASLATAVAKVACARAAVEASSMLFEFGGTRAAADGLNLSRFWRDGRTHTLHDPVRWKVQHIGRWVLSRTPPPRHGLL